MAVFIFLLFYLPFFGWETTEWVWNMGLATQCERGVPEDPFVFFEKPNFKKQRYLSIQDHEIVWIRPSWVKKFSQKVLPQVKHPFVLVISDGDESFPSNTGLSPKQIEDLLNHPKILHIFAQNCDRRHPRLSPLPIGLDYHTLAYKKGSHAWGPRASPLEQEKVLNEILAELKPTRERKKRAFVDFQHANSMRANFHRYLEFGEDRMVIFERLKKTGLIDYGPKMSRAELWKTKGEYAFSISPHGNGLDCHRTWEDLILGCIVVVKTSPLDPLYEGLPVVIVRDWEEVTEENLDLWLLEYGDAFTRPEFREKLKSSYWLQRIRSKTVPPAASNPRSFRFP